MVVVVVVGGGVGRVKTINMKVKGVEKKKETYRCSRRSYLDSLL